MCLWSCRIVTVKTIINNNTSETFIKGRGSRKCVKFFFK